MISAGSVRGRGRVLYGVAAAVLCVAGLSTASSAAAPVAMCGGKAATITGTEAGETLTPTPGDDIIVAHGGDDTINLTTGNESGRGTDLICLGEGKDTVKGRHGGHLTVYGGNGADTLNGATGSTGVITLRGEGGNDHLYMLGGNRASLYGGAGDDVITGDLSGVTGWGGEGNDTLTHGRLAWRSLTFHGGPGKDTLTGGFHGDTLNGDDGDDRIIGGIRVTAHRTDNDTIHGGAGDDVIGGGAQADTIYGDGGNDHICGDWLKSRIECLEPSQGGADTLHGGAGDDVLDGGATHPANATPIRGDMAHAGDGFNDLCMNVEGGSGCERYSDTPRT